VPWRLKIVLDGYGDDVILSLEDTNMTLSQTVERIFLSYSSLGIVSMNWGKFRDICRKILKSTGTAEPSSRMVNELALAAHSRAVQEELHR
jgi:hypothetical protein